MSLITHDADAFRRTHPNWPHTSPGEWPLTGRQAAEDAGFSIVTGPLDDEDKHLIREQGGE